MRSLWLVLLGFLFISPAFAADLKLDAALQKAQAAYTTLHDYTAVFQKQETSAGVMGPEEAIFLKFEKPFKIFMAWLNTHKKDLQVLYERGQRDNKLAIHQPGLLLGLAQVIYLDQSSPWVREGSASYNIEDAGIGTFLEDFAKAVTKGTAEGKLKTEWLDDDTVNAAFEGSKEGEGYFTYRVIVHFDPKTLLPDRMRLFDWKDAPMGNYAYEDLKLDAGDADPKFKKIAIGKLYRLYFPASKSAASKNFNGKNLPATPTAT